MNEYGGLIDKIEKELNIKKEVQEIDNVWKSRLVYSVMGYMARASLYDVLEENLPISVTHIKRKCQRIQKAYLDLFPDISEIIKSRPEELSEEIYSVLLNSGCLYHTPNRVLPSVERRVPLKQIEIVRGAPINEKLSFSGLGTYKTKQGDQGIESLMDLFQIPCQRLVDYGKYLINKANWKDFKSDSRIEYLRMEPPFSRGYWKDTPEMTGSSSLLRIGEKGRYIYYIYRGVGKKIIAEELPNWMVSGYEYRYISNSLLAVNTTLPAVKVKKGKYTVMIKQEYLLPPSILNFIKLYSWPTRFSDLPCDFERVMSIEIFEVLKDILDYIGIEVKE